MTEVEEAVGSRWYIAPENESGVNEANDQRPADFYAFGKLMWAVLAGRNPPERERQLDATHQLDALLQNERYRVLNQLQERLLDSDPRSRLSDCAAVIGELELAISTFEGRDRRPPTSRERSWRRPDACAKSRVTTTSEPPERHPTESVPGSRTSLKLL